MNIFQKYILPLGDDIGLKIFSPLAGEINLSGVSVLANDGPAAKIMHRNGMVLQPARAICEILNDRG